MTDPLRHVKPAVRALKAYTLAARQAPIKINQNENPFELPEDVRGAAIRSSTRASSPPRSRASRDGGRRACWPATAPTS
jgi:histidinol-phosphate/aromatic aminotransferase/cobyric acid decarboxylase-like protein